MSNARLMGGKEMRTLVCQQNTAKRPAKCFVFDKNLYALIYYYININFDNITGYFTRLGSSSNSAMIRNASDQLVPDNAYCSRQKESCALRALE